MEVQASQDLEFQIQETMMEFSSLVFELDGEEYDDLSSGLEFAKKLKNQVRDRFARDQKEINELRAQLTEKRLTDDAIGHAVNQIVYVEK